MKRGVKECLVRALRTFFQAALGYAAVDLVSVVRNNTGDALDAALRGLFVSAVAAGLAAIMNLPSKETENAPALPETDVKGGKNE